MKRWMMLMMAAVLTVGLMAGCSTGKSDSTMNMDNQAPAASTDSGSGTGDVTSPGTADSGSGTADDGSSAASGDSGSADSGASTDGSTSSSQ